MKAVLVVNIPYYLKVEDVKIKYELFARTNNLQICGNYNLNDLRPLPEKKGKYGELRMFDTDFHYEIGWNNCLDEILGETE